MTKVVRTNAFPKHRTRSNRLFFRNLIIFLLAFCLSATVLRQALPKVSQTIPYIQRLSEKLAYFEQHKDEFDAVFIGSSRVYRQVSPEIFNREVATRLDRDVKSFNFGVPSMKMPETYFWLEKILAMKPKNLKWIFVEANNNVYEPLANARTNRVIYWHTPSSTLMALKFVLSIQEEPPFRKARSVYSHFLPLFYNLFSFGGLSNEFDALTNPARFQGKNEYSDYLGNAVDGYRPLEEVSSEGSFNRRRKVYLEQLDAYRERVNSFAASPIDTSPASTGEKAFILQFSELISRANAVPIFVIPPKLKRENSLTSLYVEGTIKTLLAFNDPHQYPILFDPEYRFDEGHLNAKGAEKFTNLLADHFVQSLNLVRSTS